MRRRNHRGLTRFALLTLLAWAVTTPLCAQRADLVRLPTLPGTSDGAPPGSLRLADAGTGSGPSRLPDRPDSAEMAPRFAQAVSDQVPAEVFQSDTPADPASSSLPSGTYTATAFPPLPPPPNFEELDPLPPLDEELWYHGGSYLYHPEGDHLGMPCDEPYAYHQHLRLPETWQKPLPLTCETGFLDPDPIRPWPPLHWFGQEGFQWEPRFVGYGGYELFAAAFEEGDTRSDAIGHQLLADFDLRITGTERAHVQFRPLGRRNSGGSYYRFSDPEGYDDNSTLVPDRWWVEGEFYSIFGGLLSDPFAARDYHFVMGKFPMLLQNGLLLNDDILGVAVNKNTLMPMRMSNLNIQTYYAFDDVNAFQDSSSDLFGVNAFIDWRRVFFEFSYANLSHARDSSRDANYLAISGTRFIGTCSFTCRALFKLGDEGGRGSGQLFTVESNYSRHYTSPFLQWAGIEHGLYYANGFQATQGWNSISGGNFDRIRSTFEVNPLVRLSRAPVPDNTYGAAFGVQLFRHHEDESIIPEIAFEAPDEDFSAGFGLRYLRKLGPRTFFDARGLKTWSDAPELRREGIFLSTTVLF